MLTLLRRPAFKLPRNLLGADLFWWRSTPELETLVTIFPSGVTSRLYTPLPVSSNVRVTRQLSTSTS